MDNEQLDEENMNDKDVAPSSDGPPSFDDVSSLDDDDSKRSNTALIWRVLALGVALIIIAVLAYPYIQQQFQSNDNLSNAPVVGPTEAPALENEASTPEEWFELGKDYYKQNQWSLAIVAFQKVIELDPTYQAAYANLGAAYHRQNNLDLAVAQYQKALELNPDDGDVVYNLAAVYIQQAAQGGGQPDPELLNQAIEQLNHALELSPNSAEPYFGLGVAYAALNQPQESIAAFESFLEYDAGNDPRAQEEAKRYLQLLRGQ
jgi:tetratricopeptide (TPR) repeat protein